MSHPNFRPRPATIARVVHDPRRRSVGRGPDIAGKREFKSGDAVRSLTRVVNDGIYPHRDIGEALVNGGDIGVVRESWSFLGESYYTVEFFARAAVVILRGQEMARAALRGGIRSAR
ncbi:MAG: nitrogen fixation protein NifZ [Pseudomonadota bacterium]